MLSIGAEYNKTLALNVPIYMMQADNDRQNENNQNHNITRKKETIEDIEKGYVVAQIFALHFVIILCFIAIIVIVVRSVHKYNKNKSYST